MRIDYQQRHLELLRLEGDTLGVLAQQLQGCREVDRPSYFVGRGQRGDELAQPLGNLVLRASRGVSRPAERGEHLEKAVRPDPGQDALVRPARNLHGAGEHAGQQRAALLGRKPCETAERDIAAGMPPQPHIEHRARAGLGGGSVQVRVAEQAATGREIGVDREHAQQIESRHDDGALRQRRRIGDLEDSRLGQRTAGVTRGREQNSLELTTHFGASRTEVRHDDRETRRWLAVEAFGRPASGGIELARRVVAVDPRQVAATHRQGFDRDVDAASAQALDEQVLCGSQLVEPDQSQRSAHRCDA